MSNAKTRAFFFCKKKWLNGSRCSNFILRSMPIQVSDRRRSFVKKQESFSLTVTTVYSTTVVIIVPHHQLILELPLAAEVPRNALLEKANLTRSLGQLGHLRLEQRLLLNVLLLTFL